jgi:hypothetical protein
MEDSLEIRGTSLTGYSKCEVADLQNIKYSSKETWEITFRDKYNLPLEARPLQIGLSFSITRYNRLSHSSPFRNIANVNAIEINRWKNTKVLGRKRVGTLSIVDLIETFEKAWIIQDWFDLKGTGSPKVQKIRFVCLPIDLKFRRLKIRKISQKPDEREKRILSSREVVIEEEEDDNRKLYYKTRTGMFEHLTFEIFIEVISK